MIVEIDGDEVTEAAAVRDAILDKEPGDTVRDQRSCGPARSKTVEAELATAGRPILTWGSEGATR